MKRILLSLLLVLAAAAHALTHDEARAIASGETDARIEALNKAVANPDDRTAAFLQALADNAVKVAGEQVFVVRDDKATDPVSGAPATLPPDAEDVVNNNRMRGELDNAIAALQLFSPDAQRRSQAVKVLRGEAGEAGEARLPLIEKAYAAETDAQIREQLAMIRAAVLLASSDKERRMAAARLLAQSNSPATKHS